MHVEIRLLAFKQIAWTFGISLLVTGIAVAFAKNSQCRLAGQTPPDFPQTDTTYDLIKARLAQTIDIVQSIGPKDLEDAATRTITYKLGPDLTMSQNGLDYLVTFCLPNFYFHATTAYDILRHNGLNIGKMDFLAGAFDVPSTS